MKLTMRYYGRTAKGKPFFGDDAAGLDAMGKDLLEIPQEAMREAAFGAYAAAQDVMALARERAPREDGYLEAGGFVTKPEIKDGSFRLVLGFGGPAGLYLVRQHEDTSLGHPGARAIAKGVTKVGQPKFLTSAVNEKESSIIQTIKAYIQAALEGKRPSMPPKQFPETPTEQAGSSKVRGVKVP